MTDATSPFLEATIRTATPLALAALGETVVERAGVVNIGLEGVIIAGAFAAAATAGVAGISGAFTTAVLAGLSCTALLGILIVTLRADQIVAGTAELSAYLEPVEPRHHHVEHHRVGPIVGDQIERFDAILGQRNGIAVE